MIPLHKLDDMSPQFCYSVLLHAAVLLLLFTVPVNRSGATELTFEGYVMYLMLKSPPSETAPLPSAAQVRPKDPLPPAVQASDNGTAHHEDKETKPLQRDTEKVSEAAQDSNNLPGLADTAKKTEEQANTETGETPVDSKNAKDNSATASVPSPENVADEAMSQKAEEGPSLKDQSQTKDTKEAISTVQGPAPAQPLGAAIPDPELPVVKGPDVADKAGITYRFPEKDDIPGMETDRRVKETSPLKKKHKEKTDLKNKATAMRDTHTFVYGKASAGATPPVDVQKKHEDPPSEKIASQPPDHVLSQLLQSSPYGPSFFLPSEYALTERSIQEPKPVADAPKVFNPETASAEMDHGRPPESKLIVEKPSLVIPVPPDMRLKLEIGLREDEMRDVSMRLARKAYPAAGERVQKGKDEEVEMKEEYMPSPSSEKGKVKKVFSVPGVDRGRYTLSIIKRGETACTIDVAFFFFKGSKNVRVKEYRAVKLPNDSAAKFKFIIPDAIFWDDEDRFSGSIEDSDSFTKFNDEAGLVWREEKDY